MAFPEDYYLPAKSVFEDGPISGDPAFYHCNENQIDGLALILAERWKGGAVISTKPVYFTPVTRKRLLKIRIFPSGVGAGAVLRIGTETIFDGDITDAIEARPNFPWQFVSWSGDITSTTNPLTLPDSDIITLFATFKLPGDPDPDLPSLPLHVPLGGALIGSFMSSIEDCAPFFLDTNTHPTGDLEGLSTYTVWTKAALFSTASVGISGDWTSIPSRNRYGLAASAGFHSRVPRYKEHLNEPLTIANLLDYAIRPATVEVVSDPPGVTIVLRVTLDLSLVATGTAKCYLKVSGIPGAPTPLPPVATDGKWHFWQTATVGGVWNSPSFTVNHVYNIEALVIVKGWVYHL